MIVYGFITRDDSGVESIYPMIFINVEKLHEFIRNQGWEKIVSIKSPDGEEFLKGLDVWMEPSKSRTVYSCEDKYVFSGALGIVYKFALVEDE